MRPKRARQLLVMLPLMAILPALAQAETLPTRETPPPRTTDGVPHVQIGIHAVPELSEALLKAVGELPGVNLGPTRVSLPGAIGFQLADDMPLAHPEVIVGGREFAHLHPDGSLHVSLEPEMANAAIKSGWAVSHPWADQREGWDGFVMIFTPSTQFELNIVIRLVRESYDFVTGRELED
ncbi:DUF5519 family protein [Rhodobacteraceae bacterium M382]|nr:DUF5519 family protein [Rhodobacteraceae bacterium M382]